MFKRWPWQWHAVAAEKRKTRAKIRAWSRASAVLGGNHVAAVEIGILIGRDKNCGRSRIHIAVETRSSASTFRFKCRSPVRLVRSAWLSASARIKSRRCFALKSRDRYDTERVSLACGLDHYTLENNRYIDRQFKRDLDLLHTLTFNYLKKSNFYFLFRFFYRFYYNLY